MFTVIQTDRGASDREIEDGVFRNCGLDVEFRRLELEDEDALIEACANADALIPGTPRSVRACSTLCLAVASSRSWPPGSTA